MPRAKLLGEGADIKVDPFHRKVDLFTGKWIFFTEKLTGICCVIVDAPHPAVKGNCVIIPSLSINCIVR